MIKQTNKPVEEQSLWYLFGEAMNARISKLTLDSMPNHTVYKGETILQITPANNVVAVFDDGEYPVLCWCLKEENWIVENESKTIRRVVGMVIVGELVGLQCVDGPDNNRGFIEYRYS